MQLALSQSNYPQLIQSLLESITRHCVVSKTSKLDVAFIYVASVRGELRFWGVNCRLLRSILCNSELLDAIRFWISETEIRIWQKKKKCLFKPLQIQLLQWFSFLFYQFAVFWYVQQYEAAAWSLNSTSLILNLVH